MTADLVNSKSDPLLLLEMKKKQAESVSSKHPELDSGTLAVLGSMLGNRSFYGVKYDPATEGTLAKI